MTPREERGLVIAALCKLNKGSDGVWKVPSQTPGMSDKQYIVNPKAQTCSCPDHSENGHKCKHLFAVEMTMKREHDCNGTVTETKTLTFTEKKTYPQQNWPAYEAAQSIEKDRLQELLADLLRGIPEPERTGCGRKPHSVRNSIFAMVYKVYCLFSSRRFTSDLRQAWKRGFMSHSMPGRKVCEFFENPAFTPILKELVVQSARPLRSVETKFAIDSSGFSTNRFYRWYDEKYGCTRQKCGWVKCHIACGVKTNVCTAIRILDKDTADSPQFVPLVQETARGFTISEVSADKAYASLENFEAVAACGGTGYLDFKSNTTGAKGGLFEKMFHYFQFRKEEFMEHYHKRSNVESTFSMVKRKFADSVLSKTETATVNEVICKFIAHNLCCLIQEQHELWQRVSSVLERRRPVDSGAALPGCHGIEKAVTE